jgi:hypothetical protein
MAEKVYPIIPAPSSATGTILVLFALLLALAIIFGYFAFSIRNIVFVLNESGLRIKKDLYGRMIPKEQLIVRNAKIVNLTEEEELRPRMRTNGLSLPGYQSGWFRLKNGEKALLFLSDRKQALYIPTTKEFSLLISPENPRTFLEDLKNL